MKQRQRRSPARARVRSRKVLALVLFAALASAAGLSPLRPGAASAARAEEAPPAGSAASTPELLWMNGGHAGGSGKAALSPDGQLLATADYSEVFVWRYADGRLLRTFGAYWLGSMKCVRFTPDGRHVVGAGTWIPGQTRATILMWRVSDGALVREFGVGKDVKSIALSADGRNLAAAVGGGEPSVILYDVATGAAVRTLGAFAANAVAFSRDGFVAAAGADEFGDPPTVAVWRASDGLQVAKLFGLSFITDAVAFSPDGRYLAAGDWGGNGTTPKVQVWLAPAFLPVRTLSPYAGSGGALAFTPDSQSLAAVGADGVGVWHLPDGLLTKTVPVFTGEATWNLIFSDADTLFASGAQALAGVWRVSDGARVRAIGAEREFVTSAAFSHDGAHLVTSNGHNHASDGPWHVEMFRSSDGARVRTFAAHNDIINSVAFSPDGTRVASGSGSQPPDTRDTRIFVSPASGVGAPLVLHGHEGGTLSVAFSPDGRTLASGGRDKLIRLWRVSDGAAVRSLSGHTNWVNSIAYSPDGQTIVSAGDATVRFWRASDGAPLRSITPDGYPVGTVAFSPDGQTVASTTYNGVQLWRASDGAPLRSMFVTAGYNNLGNVVFSADGSVVSVANGSYAPVVWFWRVSDGVLLKTYNGETGWVQPPALAVSPDGARLALGRYDSIVAMARHPFAAGGAGSYTPAYEGEQETTDCNQIAGWAWDSKQPDGTVNVDVYDGSALLATIPANEYRQDFAGVKGNGHHGFRYTIPAGLKTGTPRTLSVRFAGTNTHLTNSPRSVTCGSAPQPGAWAGAAGMPTARRALASGVINGRVYAAGGDASNGARGVPNVPLNTLEAYDPATNSWAARAPMPTPRFGAAGGAVGGRLYVAGGWNADLSQGDGYRDALEAYDPATNSWATLAPMPRRRHLSGSGAVGGKLYVVGGYDPAVGYTGELSAYDPATNSWATLAPMPTPRYALAAVVLDGRLYAVGGGCLACGNPSSGYSRDLEVYDPATNSWKKLAPMPAGRLGHAAGVVNGKIYVFGGERSAAVETVDVYDPATNTWGTTAPMQTPRKFLAGATVGARLYALGGVDAANVVRNTVEVFTPGALTTPTPTPTPIPTPTSTPTPNPTPTPTPAPTPSSTPAPMPTPTPTPDIIPPAGPPLVYVEQNAPASAEGAASLSVAVRRTGDLSQPSAVDYATADGTALEGRDYVAAYGTLHFAAGEVEKRVAVLVIDDGYTEPDESFTLTLRNASNAQLGAPNVSRLTIRDADPGGQSNPVDATEFFVRQHYLDFLGRDADPSGHAHWAGGVDACGADAVCREVRRVNTSAAFFLSIEFQETGFLAHRIYKAAFGDMPGAPVPLRREEFMPDTARLGRGVVVGESGWRRQLEENRDAFALEFVTRARFAEAYPAGMSAADFVARLNANTGGALSDAEAAALADELAAAGPNDARARAAALRRVAEHAEVSRREFKRAFVLAQYFGYLRRNPNEGADADFSGYRFWLSKLEQFGGDYVRAEMVRAFLDSAEYRQRFGR